MESGTDTVRSDTTCNRPYSKRTLSAEHYTGYHSAESDMDLSPTEDGKNKLRAYSHQMNVGAKRKRSKYKQKRPKNKNAFQ